MNTITLAQYDALCTIVDRAKNDDRSEDTGVYADAIVEALGLLIQAVPETDDSERVLGGIQYGADISIHIVETIDYRRDTTLLDLIEAADPEGKLTPDATLDDLFEQGHEQSGFDEWLEKNGDVRGQERSVKVVEL